jgi:DNA-binding transcriptional LysR family regulator
MELRELRYFVALAEELHFARAAARVCIEQSPLSKAIAELERNLGVDLFIRTRRSTQLTAGGEVLLLDARRILAAVDQARHNIRRAASGRLGRLRIAVCDGLSHCRVASMIAESRRDDPEVDIHIVHSRLRTQLKDLCSGSLDIGFALSPSDVPQVRSLPLWDDAVTLIMRPDHPLSMHASVREMPNDIGELIVLGERPVHGADWIEKWFLLSGKSCQTIEYVANIELLLTLVAAGYGVGVVASPLAAQISRADLVIRPVCVQEAIIRVFLLQRANDRSTLVTRFIERARRMA